MIYEVGGRVGVFLQRVVGGYFLPSLKKEAIGALC